MLNALTALWRSHHAKLALSIFCVAIALFDTFWRTLSPIAAGALAIAIVPWALGIIERISAPGGFEIVLAKAERQLDELKATPNKDDRDAFKYFESSDPNLAVALLRIQIERRLRQIAEDAVPDYNPQRKPITVRALAEDLARSGAIPKEAASLLNDLMPVMNAAAHGAELQPAASNFALAYGPKILAMLKTHNGKAERV